jgi:DNA-binding transcriptional regulator YhcF (GntR family)
VPSEPPYLQIAADLRRRIAAGELRPGDRLPSTRALAAQCGVALATAGRAVAELRRAGVVRTQDRAGTIVAPRGPARRTREPGRARPTELTRDRVVRAAIELADVQGLEALSMRAVAAHLDVATMSLYRHVAGKDELVLLMADAAYGEPRRPAPGGGWRAVLESAARTLWRLYHRHPWLAQLGPLARPLPLPNLLGYSEAVVGALSGLGLPPARVLDLHILLYQYGQGLAANLEREAHARSDTGLSDEQWVDSQLPAFGAIVGSGAHPHFAALMTGLGGDYQFDLDVLFETGLRALLDGVERLVEREVSTSRRPPG